MTGPRVVVVGDLGVDVLVTPTATPVPGGDVPARIRTTAGGAGANTAAWLAHLGTAVTLVARVGDDGPGRAAVAELEAAGVTVAAALDPDRATCTVVVLVDDDRTMLSDRGAASGLAPTDLPPLHGAGHLHLSGYVLADPASRPAGLAALAAARDAGWGTSVDPQGAVDAGFLDWVRGVDLLLPNTAELAVLGGSAAALLDVVEAVVVTSGRDGARWIGRDGTHTAAAPRPTGATPTGSGDPTGAGDAFDAGLLAARLGGAGPEQALRAGCAAGAAAAGRRGARP